MSRFGKILCLFLVVAGIITAFLPQISNYIFTRETDVIVKQYADNIKDEELEKIWNAAVKWNEIVNNASNTKGTKSGLAEYEEQLNINGIMGYISIPAISVQLPIYHGTNDNTLAKGVGHLKNSSLPVGGRGTHCVLTGHTGRAEAELFNNISKLKKGDKFYLTVAGHVLAYEVDNIATVQPDDVELLEPVEGKDYCTLVTCTPYGVNTHRLLVRGVRTNEKTEESAYYLNDKKNAMLLIAVPTVLILIVIIVLIWRRHAKKKHSI